MTAAADVWSDFFEAGLPPEDAPAEPQPKTAVGIAVEMQELAELLMTRIVDRDVITSPEDGLPPKPGMDRAYGLLIDVMQALAGIQNECSKAGL